MRAPDEKNKIEARIEITQWDVLVDGKAYRVRRQFNHTGWDEGSVRWTVHSTGGNQTRWCDPDKSTFKKVVRAVKGPYDT
jgi:hypothetical protein